MSGFDRSQEVLAIPVDTPVVMGILNTTPDSFSDGGSWGTVDRAVSHAEQMIADGATIIDIGGESTRPGAHRVTTPEELERVLPVIERLAGRCTMSIDTMKADVAEAALKAGACVVNDVSASLESVAAAAGAGWIAMHMLGQPATMQDDPQYNEVVGEVAAELSAHVERARQAGVGRVWVDPGIGFGKTTEHNLALLHATSTFVEISPVVMGVSRKRLIGELHQSADSIVGNSENVPAKDRLEGSVAAAVWAWRCGANIVRTHDVKTTAAAARLFSGPKRNF